MQAIPHQRFLRLDPEWSSPERAGVTILPVPYEQTTSYIKGTIDAPGAILDASQYLELYDEELDAEIFRLCGGIATLPALRFGEGCRDADAVETIRQSVRRELDRNKMVVCIGGEHTIAIGPAQAYTERFGDISILHFDAHSDLRQVYEGSPYSHGCSMARIYDFNRNIVQVGIRSQGKEEADFIKEHRIATFYDVAIKQGRYGPGTSWHEAVIERLHDEVYITFDCDFFDPSLIPALGTPEPGGFGWDETLALLRKLSLEKRIVGFDINELSPAPPYIHSQFIIAKLIYKLIGYIVTGRERAQKSPAR